MIEAICTRCRETFVPHQATPEDIIHGETEAGKECGGIGVIRGQWVTDARWTLEWKEVRLLVRMEMHGKEYPNCLDPDCEYHHPEVIEF